MTATATTPIVAVPRRTVSTTPDTANVASGGSDAEIHAGDRSAITRFVRGYDGGGCFAALPGGPTASEASLSGFSRDETALGQFNEALGRSTGARAAGRQVSQAQCSALAFARSQAAYPDFAVRLAVSPDRIPSGGTIRGIVSGTADQPVTLLILDDEGRIQDASFLLSGSEDGTRSFETPLSLTGDPVPTVQLFVVLAGGDGIAALRPPVPVEARRYFQEIARRADERGISIDVAIAAFTVDRNEKGSAP